MSILSQQPPARSTPSLTEHPTLTRPLLSIPRPQHAAPAISAALSSSSSASSSVSSPPLDKSARHQKRRKLRSTRAGSSSSSLPTSPPSPDTRALRLLNKNAAAGTHTHSSHCKPDPDGDDDAHPLPVARLQLSRTAPPVPPPIPADVIIPPSRPWCWPTPLAKRSANARRSLRNDTHTCIRTTTNPYSVSLSTQPPRYFARLVPRQPRGPRVLLSSDSQQLESNRTEEQEKWWYWTTNCRVTGDGNKASFLGPLPCRDLYPGDDVSILTKGLRDCPIENQKFFCSYKPGQL